MKDKGVLLGIGVPVVTSVIGALVGAVVGAIFGAYVAHAQTQSGLLFVEYELWLKAADAQFGQLGDVDDELQGLLDGWKELHALRTQRYLEGRLEFAALVKDISAAGSLAQQADKKDREERGLTFMIRLLKEDLKRRLRAWIQESGPRVIGELDEGSRAALVRLLAFIHWEIERKEYEGSYKEISTTLLGTSVPK